MYRCGSSKREGLACAAVVGSQIASAAATGVARKAWREIDKGNVTPLRDDSPAPVSGLSVVGRHLDENPPRPAKRPASTALSAGIKSSGMRIRAPPKPPGGRPKIGRAHV